MASQAVFQKFEELKKAGKINSEIEAFVEGKIWALNEETDEILKSIDATLKEK